jgi:hypothetical protein
MVLIYFGSKTAEKTTNRDTLGRRWRALFSVESVQRLLHVFPFITGGQRGSHDYHSKAA